MTIEKDSVYASKKGQLVRVMNITEWGWIEYRKCDERGDLLAGTRTACTRDGDFARRFPVVHGHI